MKMMRSDSFCEEVTAGHSSHGHIFSFVRVLLAVAVVGLALVNIFLAEKSTFSLTAISGMELGMTDDLTSGSISAAPQLKTIYKAYKANQIESQVHQRNITFLMPSDRGSWREAYSGMWWQSKHQFLQTNWSAGWFTMPITGSEKVIRGPRCRQTRDWLDFSVEHLSILWKHFTFKPDSQDEIVYSKIRETLDRYINDTEALDIPRTSAASATLAILPFFARKNDTDLSIKERALGATLVSLWRIGIGRSIVIASSKDEKHIVGRVFDSLEPKFSQRPMQLAFHRPTNISATELKIMPKVALSGLKLAMEGNFSKSLTEEWLGPVPSRWKFVYFTEPDLILHARQSAMDAIKKEMKRGGVLSAHRFMPLPHQRSFPGYNRMQKVVPDIGPFSIIHEVNVQSGDACCDAGKYYPSNPMQPSKPEEFFPCKEIFLMWWRCGFFQGKRHNYTDIATVAELHRRVTRPLITLTGGTGFPLIHNNQKVCFPNKPGACD